MTAGRAARALRLIDVVLLLLLATRVAAAGALVDPLAAARDPAALAAAIATIEAAHDGDDLADALLAAGRACEDQLADPARALRLYDRVLHERPDARAAIAAGRRARALRAEQGADGAHGAEADELARVIAAADTLPTAEVEARAEALATRVWPGAADAALWLARWEQRTGRCDAAQPRFEAIAARWPGTDQAVDALRGASRCALDAHAWGAAEQLAAQLPAGSPAEVRVRDDLAAAAARGRALGWLAVAAWLVIGGVLAAFGLALARATRGLPLRRRLRPPLEAIFAAPLVGILIAITATTFPVFAPAVAQITLGGFALAWLSGATLAALRAAGRATRARAVAHAVACALTVIALAYVVMTRTDLIDQLVQTARYGPGV